MTAGVRARRVLGAALLALAAAPGLALQPPVRPQDVAPVRCAPGATPEYIPRLLRVTVNASDSRQDLVFLQRPCGALLARVADLEALRIRTAGQSTVQIDGEAWVNLNAYEGLVFALSESEQRLAIEGESWVFHPTVLDLEPQLASAPERTPPGGFLNYGLFTSGAVAGVERPEYSASAGLGLFQGERVLLSDWVYYNRPGSAQVFRLDTTLVQDFPERVSTLRVGDVFARGGSYGGGAALAGVQYGTNFATRPGLSITPVQMLEAATNRASGVGLYINPQDPERASRSVFLGSLTTVPHGPVELINVPTYNNGEYELLLRDALGREVLVRQPFYFSAGLLRQGLHDFSYELGALRREFGGDEYGGALASATHRYGFSNRFTAEAHAAAAEQGGVGGLTGLWSVPRLGVVGATVAASGSDLVSGAGALGGVSLENRYERYAFALRHDCQTQEFLLPTVQAVPASTPICRSAAGVSGALPWGASLGLSAAQARVRGGDDRQSLRLGYTTRPWPGAHLTTYAGWSGTLRGDELSAGLVFSASLAVLSRAGLTRVAGLDVRRTQFGASAVFEEGDGAGQAVGRLSTGGRLGDTAVGVQASSSLSGVPQQSLTGSAAAPALNAVAGVQSTAEVDTYAGGVTGAVAFLGGRWKPTRPLYSSFALVRLGADNAGVRVNGLRADARGDVLVSALQAYAENPVAVNGADLPMSARFTTLTEPVVPRFRSGVVVEPRIEYVRDAMLTVLVRDGDGGEVPIPPGAYATHPRSEERFPAGEDGAIYVAGLQAADTVTVSWRGASCELPVRLPADAPRDAIPELGPFVCEDMVR